MYFYLYINFYLHVVFVVSFWQLVMEYCGAGSVTDLVKCKFAVWLNHMTKGMIDVDDGLGPCSAEQCSSPSRKQQPKNVWRSGWDFRPSHDGSDHLMKRRREKKIEKINKRVENDEFGFRHLSWMSGRLGDWHGWKKPRQQPYGVRAVRTRVFIQTISFSLSFQLGFVSLIGQSHVLFGMLFRFPRVEAKRQVSVISSR